MSKFNKITPSFIKKLVALAGSDAVFTQAERLEKHARDFSQDIYFLPEVVVVPSGTEVVSTIMALCNKQRIPVTVQGARSGLTGSAVPVH